MKLLSTTVIGLLASLSFNATALSTNQFSYVGLSMQDNRYNDLNFAPNIDTTQLSPLNYNDKTSETGWRGFVGHQFNRYIGVEVGLTTFGKASFSVTEEVTDENNKTTINNVYNGEFKTFAGDIRVVGTYPINDSFFLKAQIGALAWDNEFSYLVQDPNGLTVQKNSDTGVSLLTGLGIAYGFNDLVAISLDIERTEIAKITTDNIGMSLLVRF